MKDAKRVKMAIVGDFYEFAGEDAELVANSLDLVLTKRGKTPMVGFPIMASNAYLEKLSNLGILADEGYWCPGCGMIFCADDFTIDGMCKTCRPDLAFEA